MSRGRLKTAALGLGAYVVLIVLGVVVLVMLLHTASRLSGLGG